MMIPSSSPVRPASVGERTALCTVLSDDFVPGFAVLVHSLKQKHPGLSLPFIVVHNDKLAALSNESRALVSRLYPHVVYHEADDSRYETVWANRDQRLNTPERLKSAFFILEAFNLTGFDRVITLDSDMICTGDLSPLFEHTAPFAATRGTNYKTGQRMDYFNTGVMVIGRPHLTGETYRALLNHRISTEHKARKGKADQAILNDFFPLPKVHTLDEAFNVTKRKYPDSAFDQVDDLLAGDVRILHFVGEKPWQLHNSADESNYTKLEAFWASLLTSALSFEDLLQHLRHQQLKLNTMQELQGRFAELRRYTGTVDSIITKLLDDLGGTLPDRKPSWRERFIRLFRRDSRALRRGVDKARRNWSRHHSKMERKLTAIAQKP